MADFNIDQCIETLKISIAAIETRTNDRFNYLDSTLKTTFDANEKRLEHMNEFREALNDQTTSLITRSEVSAMMQVMADKHAAEIGPLDAKMDEISKPNYALIVAFVTVVASVITGGWVVLGLKIDNSNTPISLSLEQIRANQANYDRLQTDVNARFRQLEISTGQSYQADNISKTDRQQLNERLKVIENQMSLTDSDRRAKQAEIDGKIIELHTLSEQRVIARTQAVSELKNWIQLLWDKTFPGQRFPK